MIEGNFLKQYYQYTCTKVQSPVYLLQIEGGVFFPPSCHSISVPMLQFSSRGLLSFILKACSFCFKISFLLQSIIKKTNFYNVRTKFFFWTGIFLFSQFVIISYYQPFIGHFLHILFSTLCHHQSWLFYLKMISYLDLLIMIWSIVIKHSSNAILHKIPILCIPFFVVLLNVCFYVAVKSHHPLLASVSADWSLRFQVFTKFCPIVIKEAVLFLL